MAGLYVHIPFRVRYRAYDDAFVVTRSSPDYKRFARALANDIRLQAQTYGDDSPLRSVYAGGGRPSLLPLALIRPLMEAAEDFKTQAVKEVTAEVSPADATAKYLEGLAAMGFNRVSISALSFFDQELNAIGAPHTVFDVKKSIEYARESGINNISLDIVFGWPESTLSNFKETLEQAVALNVPHITLIEWPTTSVDDAGEMERTKQYRHALLYLQENGFEPYEISHFAKSGHRSHHNENYWTHGSFLGIGPAAHSFWWYPENENPRRWANVSNIDQYADLLAQNKSPVSVRQTVDRETLAEEYLGMRLRTVDGLDLTYFHRSYGVDLRTEHAALLDRLVSNNLIHPTDEGRLRLTDAGRLVCDAITARLLPN